MKLPQFYKASYNGIDFSVPSSSRTTQHALVQYHSPYASHSTKDDLGLASEAISIQAFVSGNDAYEKAAALRKELDKRGVGKLVHPSYGELEVFVQSVEEKQDYADGLFYVGFSLSFLRADERKELSSIAASADLEPQALALQKEFAAASERRMHLIPNDKQFNPAQIRKELADLNNAIQSLYRLAEVPFAFMEELLLAVDEWHNFTLAPSEIAANIMNMSANLAQAILSVPNKMLVNLKRTIANLNRGLKRLEALGNGQTLQQYQMQLQASASQIVALFYPAAQAIDSQAQSREQAQQIQQDLDALLSKIKPKVDYAQYEQLIKIEQSFYAAIASRMASLPQQKTLHTDEPLPVALHRVQGKNISLVANPFFPESGVLYVS